MAQIRPRGRQGKDQSALESVLDRAAGGTEPAGELLLAATSCASTDSARSSAEERAAGLPFHGEAYTLPWELQSHQKTGGTLSAAFSVTLPLAQETFTRTYHIVDGENIVWVDSARDKPAGVRPPRLLGRARDDQRALPRARQSRGRHARLEGEDEGVSDAAESARGSCSRSSISPGRWRRRSTARCSTCARRR